MCSISGFADFNRTGGIDTDVLTAMGESLAHRGPDQRGYYHNNVAGFHHNRLAIIDVEKGLQPMTAVYEGYEYAIVYNGELYNTDELRRELAEKGISFQTRCDTEVVLYSYIIYNEDCSERLNGIFAFAVFDSRKNSVYLSRDRFGIKPLFYAVRDGALIFASEIKALLRHPLVRAELDGEGLWQLLFLSPVRLNGSGVFRNIQEIPPAHHGAFSAEGLAVRPYWKLPAYEMPDGRKAVIENTRSLLTDAIERQLVSDVPLATFLSGGLDSSVISSVAAKKYREKNWRLSTYSFEYDGNREHFKNSLFQPQSDDEYATLMAQWLDTDHTVLTAPVGEIAALLRDAVYFRDMPGMADIDSSLLYYCRQVKKRHTVAISGECSDEVFGGYPWFYRSEMLQRGFFPWIHDPFKRVSLFDEAAVNPEKGYEYVREAYLDSLKNCPVLESDSPAMRQSRHATWLSVNYFMTSLLERKDRMSMACGLEVRVPFADHRLVEYVYNVPWEIKFENSVEKALLRNAMSDYLPDSILNRKKSPYPKTHSPVYTGTVQRMLEERLSRPDSILKRLLKPGAYQSIVSGDNDTWFGQLMSGPQLIAWLLQLDCWFRDYHITIV